jgi:hypothetical protein
MLSIMARTFKKQKKDCTVLFVIDFSVLLALPTSTQNKAKNRKGPIS